MVLEFLVDFGYDWIAYSWDVSTALVKYFILLYVVKAFNEDKLDLEGFQEILIGYSRETVLIIVLLGLVAFQLSWDVSPILPLFSEVVALVYFGFLFWKY